MYVKSVDEEDKIGLNFSEEAQNFGEEDKDEEEEEDWRRSGAVEDVTRSERERRGDLPFFFKW